MDGAALLTAPDAPAAALDRRVQRTRKALINAFNQLVLERDYDALSPADVAALANVGRSTFYEHFSGLDDLLRQTLGQLLAVLAKESLRPEPDPKLTLVVQHFWDQRKKARALIGRPVVLRLYSEIFEAALAEHAVRTTPFPLKLIAAQISAGQLALLSAWLSGQGGASAQDVAATLSKSACATATALLSDPKSP